MTRRGDGAGMTVEAGQRSHSTRALFPGTGVTISAMIPSSRSAGWLQRTGRGRGGFAEPPCPIDGTGSDAREPEGVSEVVSGQETGRGQVHALVVATAPVDL